jgi:hypothetical protein
MEQTDEQTDSEVCAQAGRRPGGVNRAIREINQSVLHSEIGFWREMLHASDEHTPPASLERMRHALALAERRFKELFVHYKVAERIHDVRSRGDQRRGQDNVHFLPEAFRTDGATRLSENEEPE